MKVNLVPSIAGKHEGWPNVILTGHVRLMKAVRNMGFRTGKGPKEKTLELECQVGTVSLAVAISHVSYARAPALDHTLPSGLTNSIIRPKVNQRRTG